MKRLKILISAHELSPYLGSECAIGWNIVTRLGKYHDITVVHAETNQTGTNNYSKNINRYISKNGQIIGVEFISVAQPWINKVAIKLNQIISNNSIIGFPPLFHFVYHQWQKKVFKLVNELLINQKPDIIHHLTSINFREPGYLWKLDIPFIWGPTGGSGMLVKGFLNNLNFRNKISEVFRNFSIFYLIKFSQKIRNASQKAKMVYAFSPEDEKFFNSICAERVKILLDTGTYLNLEKLSTNRRDQKIQGVWCGHLVARKAPEILLKSLSTEALFAKKITIKIISTGPVPLELAQLSKKLNLRNIEWITDADHKKVFEIMSKSDFLIHTSYREATTAVIPEALSIGLPVICHDISGMSVAITKNCGIKIPLISPEKSIEGFAKAMLRLINHPDELLKLKAGALNRANELSWNCMSKTIANNYLEINLKNKTIKND